MLKTSLIFTIASIASLSVNLLAIISDGFILLISSTNKSFELFLKKSLYDIFSVKYKSPVEIST